MLASALALALLVQGVQDGPAPKPDASILPGAVTGQVRTVDDVPAVNVRVIAIAVPKFGTPDLALNYFAIDNPVQQTFTDTQGNYTLVDLPPNNYYILAGAAGKGIRTIPTPRICLRPRSLWCSRRCSPIAST
jgi:hypothetical protein